MVETHPKVSLVPEKVSVVQKKKNAAIVPKFLKGSKVEMFLNEKKCFFKSSYNRKALKLPGFLKRFLRWKKRPRFSS